MNNFVKLFRKILKNIKIKKRDNIICSADLSIFLTDNQKILKIIIDEILYKIGNEGSLIMPNYYLGPTNKIIREKYYFMSPLYRFFKDNYDVNCSKSILHSHVGIGPKTKFLNKTKKNLSFGINSDFYEMEKNNFKQLLIGCNANTGFTYAHHLEKIFSVPYRQDKKIMLKIIRDKKVVSVIYNYYVRTSQKYKENFDFILNKVKKKNIYKLRFGKIAYFNLKNFKLIAQKEYKKNNFALVSYESN
tara:strand:+ start:937 stop:1674 length:738 start_codon:yes stop_codon:yes gene_type:complete